MSFVFEEGKYSAGKLFEMKKNGEVIREADQWIKENLPAFYEARRTQNFEECFRLLCRDMEIRIDNRRFVSFFDFRYQFYTQISNLTPDYGRFLQGGLESLLYDEKEAAEKEFCGRYNCVIHALLELTERIIQALEQRRPENDQNKILWFRNMRANPAGTLEEALQRILFLSQLLWQTGSRLIGLGRLDKMLSPYYETDLEKGMITKEQAAALLKDFMQTLHEHDWYKSSALLGDTGQVIILGGTDKNGAYFRNDLTDLFLDIVKEMGLSDPKAVLRVSGNIPRDLMEKAVRCMMTGVGSPLLSNDDIIIPRLQEFGAEEEDSYDYTTSACWEPLIGGRSSSLNNEFSMSYMKALHNLLLEEKLSRFDNFDGFKQGYLRYLKREIRYVEKLLYEKKYQRNTLFSVFMEGCRESRKDIVDGGAKYHNVGMTTLALSNTVNALLNIRKYVYEEKRYDLVDVKKMCVFNYKGYPEAEALLQSNEEQYGCDKEDIISLSNEILRFVTENTKDFRTPNGGKLKFGVSSPNYVMDGSHAPASFDGRKENEPFGIHISNEKVSSYTEIICFAAGLDYGENRFNGNVVDFMVNASFIEQNFEKFVLMLRRGIEVGFFQLQMNVTDSAVLMEAKKNPQNYLHLIVRVWGFSAYFVELPESYQDVLIERALRNEGRISYGNRNNQYSKNVFS